MGSVGFRADGSVFVDVSLCWNAHDIAKVVIDILLEELKSLKL